MNAVTPRRPVRDEELGRFYERVDEARRIRVTRADFLVPQVIEERDVIVRCLHGGVPGKRYRYEAGWLQEFEHDLRDCYFLAA
jgi:hypothetical protein